MGNTFSVFNKVKDTQVRSRKLSSGNKTDEGKGYGLYQAALW